MARVGRCFAALSCGSSGRLGELRRGVDRRRCSGGGLRRGSRYGRDGGVLLGIRSLLQIGLRFRSSGAQFGQALGGVLRETDATA